jgi:phosphate transport system permease protein
LRESSKTRGLGDTLFTLAVWASAAVVAGGFLWLVGDVLASGWSALSWDFLASSPQDSGRAGGISTILVSTLYILAICLAVSIPLGLGTALYLSEFSDAESKFGRVVRASLDVLAGVPSIVFGLFGSAFFCVVLGFGYSILSGGLTLACMVLPILIRSIELGLRAVPQEYRLAAAALDISKARMIVSVLLPAAAPGLVAGLLLGIGRATAETAALIFTSGYVDRMPGSVLDSGRALSIHIYDLAMNVPGGERNAYGTALVLVGMLLVINFTATQLVERFASGRIHRA